MQDILLCHQFEELLTDYLDGTLDRETHRAVAWPLGRKSDPEGWSNAAFYQWRKQMYEAAV